MSGYEPFPYQTFSQSAGAKKFISAAAATDHGDSQAIVLQPTRRSLNAFEVGGVRLHNRSGSAAHVGLAVRFPNANWFAGQVTAAGVLTDDTTDAQDPGTGDFSMHNRAESGSGFLVGATERFNILGIIQSAAGDQTAPVLLVEYWNGAAWVDMNAATSSLLIADTLNGGGTGEKVLCWPDPAPWVIGGSGTGVSATLFNIRVRHTHGGAGTADPVASQLFVGYARMQVASVASPGQAAFALTEAMRFPKIGNALFPVFSVAAHANLVEVGVRHYW